MPKLLDWLKEKNLSHEDAMEFIEKNYKPDWNKEKEKELDDKKTEIDKPDIQEELDDLKKDEDKLSDADKKGDDKKGKLEFTEAEVKQLVAAEIAKQLKIERAEPSKGKESDKPIEQPTIKKNLFEQIV